MQFYPIKHIDLGAPSQAGHEIYLNAQYNAADSGPRHIIFKRNKYNIPQFSRFEVAFTQLACLFLSPGLTTPQQLVLGEQGSVLGLASEHMCYAIAAKEGAKPRFFVMDSASSLGKFSARTIKSASEIPIYFFDKQPADFFAQLVAAEKAGNITIDYASLANILAGSYALEEDDLHKGNFGFYLVERKEGKPQFCFFKIDHDLMFADTIMSFYGSRMQHTFHNEHAFDVTEEDLLDFPNLHDSANAYWPTKKSMINHPWNDKEYHNRAEVNAFAALHDSVEFKKAKWLAFYKHILIPTELPELVLQNCFDRQSSQDRAHVALVTQALTVRQARLRAVLLSLAEFRDFIKGLSPQDKKKIQAELLASCPIADKRAMLAEQIKGSLSAYEHLCACDEFVEGDTPLHTAIRLGDFRYEETLGMFGRFVNQRNKLGQTPLDLALEKIKQAPLHPKDIRQDLRFTMKYLLRYGAKQSDAFKDFNQTEQVEHYHAPSPYLRRVKTADSYRTFKELLRDIGEDHSLGLKLKKKLTVDCIRHWINSHNDQVDLADMLKQLKKDISDEAPELKYIRQLRTSLWIIRKIRGLYGWTTTQGEIDKQINQTLAELSARKTPDVGAGKKASGGGQFFSSADTEPLANLGGKKDPNDSAKSQPI